MATIPSLPPVEHFQVVAAAAVRVADKDGNLPSQANIIVTYRLLDNEEKLSARLWLDQQMTAAMSRLDARSARAWVNVKERITGH